MPRFKIQTVCSPDDGGWYAEVYGLQTGATLYTTRIHTSEINCQIDARYWVENEIMLEAITGKSWQR